MAYSIVINSIDRTADVLNDSLVIEDIINDQTNKCSLALIDRSGSGVPATDDEIIITDADGTVIFGGYILSTIKSKYFTGKLVTSVKCVDYTRILDRNLVHKTFEDMTDKEIIENIINTYCPGFGITTTNVIAGATIEKINFNYLQISQVFRKLAELTNKNWYIDYEKDIHFFPLTTTGTPFNISSTNDEYSKLKISNNSSQLKNRVYVRGGTKLSDFTDYIIYGDSELTKFVLPDKPHNVTIYVYRGTGYFEETVGIKNVDTEGFDWYLNFQEKYIEQDEGESVLSATDILKINYKYDIPILVAVEDTDSIAENGVQEYPIFDKSISTTELARDRATAELTDYANDIIEGSFETMTSGFVSGQYININLSEYDVNDNYLIQSIKSISIGGGYFRYSIKLASAKTIGIIKFLMNLLETNKNLIELDDDEVVDELLTLNDALLSDSLLDSLTIDSSGPYFTWCEDDTDTDLTRMRWNLFSWGV